MKKCDLNFHLLLKWGMLGLLLLVLVYCLTIGRESLNHFLGLLRSWGPIPFYSAFAVLISVGVPPTPFLFGAGAVFDLGTNFVGLCIAFTFSLAVSYGYASPLFKRQLENFMAQRAPVIAGAMQGSPVATTVLMRLIPGVPYSIQNCFLPSICGSFKVFFFASLPPLLFMATTYVMLGKNIFQGNIAGVAMLIGLVLLILLAASYIFKRRRTKQAADIAQAGS